MRFRNTVITLFIFVSIVASGCNASQSPLPTDINITYTSSVEARDKQIVELAVRIAEALFTDHPSTTPVEMYVAGDKASFVELYQTVIHLTEAEALENYSRIRGITRLATSTIVINLSVHAKDNDIEREAMLVFTIVHEFAHVLQAKLAGSADRVLNGSSTFNELSANFITMRAIITYFCVPFTKVHDAIYNMATPTAQCSDDFITNEMFYYTAHLYFSGHKSYGLELYMINMVGIYAYEQFYTTLQTEATTQGAQADLQTVWDAALDKTFGPSFETFVNNAQEYITAYEAKIYQGLQEKLGRE